VPSGMTHIPFWHIIRPVINTSEMSEAKRLPYHEHFAKPLSAVLDYTAVYASSHIGHWSPIDSTGSALFTQPNVMPHNNLLCSLIDKVGVVICQLFCIVFSVTHLTTHL
jgi:hypothetical protein